MAKKHDRVVLLLKFHNDEFLCKTRKHQVMTARRPKVGNQISCIKKRLLQYEVEKGKNEV